jgi:hypothetical protein
MKKILLLSALFLAAAVRMSSAQSSTNNHVLVEEFNSTSCPPCASLDPQMELFEQQSLGEICVLKWDMDGPIANEDPFTTQETVDRGAYYASPGIPSLCMQGVTDLLDVAGSPGEVAILQAPVLDDSATKFLNLMQNYYQMSVRHSVIGDSVIVWVTVTTGATQPTATDLNLGVVVAERFHQYLGANGRPARTDIVRSAIPPLNSDGSLNNPFSQAANTTVTYRLGTQLGDWDLTQLVAVAFIQSVGTAGNTDTKPVYQSAWDVPEITVSGNGAYNDAMPILAGNESSTASFTITNNTDSTQIVKVASGLTTPGNYSLVVSGFTTVADSSVTIPVGQSATLTASVTSNGPALGQPQYSLRFHTTDSIGIGGGSEIAFGQNIPHVVVNEWTEAEISVLQGIQTSVTNSGYGTVGLIYAEAFEQLFGLGAANDWSQFMTVIYDDPYNGGILYLTDTSLITTFLNNGGNFVLASPEFPYLFSAVYPSEGAQGTDQWMENVFQLENLNFVSGGYTSFEGVAGDPIGDKVAGHITVTAPLYTQTVYPITDSCFSVYVDPSGDTVGTRATGNGGKVFYASFELGGIIANKRDAVIKSIMDWFYGTDGVDNSVAAACALNPVYPNPVGNTATISYTIPDHQYVTLIVQDMLGRTVASLVNQEEDAGQFTVPFDASQLADGTYVCTLTAGAFKAYSKMTVDR